VSSNEPDCCCCEVYGCEEVSGGFVVACGDTSEQLEFGEEVFNQVTRFVEFFIVLALNFSVFFRRDDSLFSRLLQGFEYPFVGVEALVGDHRFGFELRQQNIGTIEFASLAFGEVKADRIAKRIDGGVNFRAQPAFTASDGLRETPFLRAPALCW
jgi:hypothetical protein